MKMKTFQADTMQETLSLVKEEMGPDAVIIKSRRTTRKVGNKIQNCFEVTAALDEALFARPTSTRDSRTNENGVNTIVPRASIPESRTSRNGAGQPVYDWKGSLRRVDEEGKATPVRAHINGNANGYSNANGNGNGHSSGNNNSHSNPPVAHNSGSLIELLRNEIREMKDHVQMPSQELKDLKVEIKAMMESAQARTQAAARADAMRNASMQINQKNIQDSTFGRRTGLASSPSSTSYPFSSVNPEQQFFHELLVEMEIEPEFANELIQATQQANAGRVTAPFGSTEAIEKDLEILAQKMSQRIRVSGGIRLTPGKPTTIALIGPTGVGKTTTLAKLAALAKLQQGKKVGIISADSFRMGANEQLELFGRTAGIPVRPVFSAADVILAQKEFSDRDLILVDTAGRSHTHLEMWRELEGLLQCLRPDEIHLVLGGPTRMRELWHQFELYRELGATSLIFTKLDECLTLGCLYNLARRSEAPLSYLCNGQIIPDHILLAQPHSVASSIVAASKNMLNANRVR